jgi:hypothetical protein
MRYSCMYCPFAGCGCERWCLCLTLRAVKAIRDRNATAVVDRYGCGNSPMWACQRGVVQGRAMARVPRCSIAVSVRRRVTEPGALARIARSGGQRLTGRPDESGPGITGPFNAPSRGPPPWNVYRIEPRAAIVTLATEPGGLTRFRSGVPDRLVRPHLLRSEARPSLQRAEPIDLRRVSPRGQADVSRADSAVWSVMKRSACIRCVVVAATVFRCAAGCLRLAVELGRGRPVGIQPGGSGPGPGMGLAADRGGCPGELTCRQHGRLML